MSKMDLENPGNLKNCSTFLPLSIRKCNLDKVFCSKSCRQKQKIIIRILFMIYWCMYVHGHILFVVNVFDEDVIACSNAVIRDKALCKIVSVCINVSLVEANSALVCVCSASNSCNAFTL